jgi:hypothetical protein
MKAWLQLLARAARTVAGWVFSFVLWTCWLGLAILLVVQLYILSANELSLPDFALRRIEEKLAESGLRATFGRTSFDPTGRVLVEKVQVWLPAFAEPVLTAESIYVRLNPLPLIVGKVEPQEVRVTQATGFVPAMLSPTGRAEKIVDQLDLVLEPGRHQVAVRQASARILGAMVSAQGIVPLRPTAAPQRGPALARFLEQRFPDLCRQALVAGEYLAAIESPTLVLDLAASESGSLIVEATALARGATLTQPLAAEARDLRASTRMLFFGESVPTDVQLDVGEITLPGGTNVKGVRALVAGRLRPAARQVDFRDLTVTADFITTQGVEATALSAVVFPRPLPRLRVDMVGSFVGSPLGLHSDLDLDRRSADISFRGEISPAVLDVISRRLKVDVRKYYSFEALTAERAEVRFGPGWKFEKLTAEVKVPRMNSYGVVMEDGRAVVELDPERFFSPEAFARVGVNFAHGTYEHHFKDHQYRFLLAGRLRPLEISPWFKEWWPNFFRQLEFPAEPPAASVDVAGFWREGFRTSVFVFADVLKPVLRGTAFDRVRTRLFIRPAFYDGLEVLATHGDADVHGRFTLICDPTTHDWQKLELGLNSTLDLKTAGQMLGPTLSKPLEQFELATPPDLKIRGTFSGPGAPAGPKDKLRIDAHSRGEFRFQRFPVQDLSFVATLEGEDLVLDDIEAGFAGGVAAGHARLSGSGDARRLGFDLSLEDATLGGVAEKVEQFFAAQKGQPPAAPGKFVQEKANVRLDFAVSAEGRYTDAMSYKGDGNATLRGGEIGEVPLLGALSALFKFTALRFTEARANFKIDHAKILFPRVELRGANSTIDAHGEYALDKRALDFNAKIFPFHESESVLKSVVGAVLTPLSNAFEVKLTGSLAQPHWAFVMGPTNFLRNLADAPDAAAKSTATTVEANPPIAKP